MFSSISEVTKCHGLGHDELELCLMPDRLIKVDSLNFQILNLMIESLFLES